jgi:hypothetical protein
MAAGGPHATCFAADKLLPACGLPMQAIIGPRGWQGAGSPSWCWHTRGCCW